MFTFIFFLSVFAKQSYINVYENDESFLKDLSSNIKMITPPDKSTEQNADGISWIIDFSYQLH